MAKIKITQTIHKDHEYPICLRCKNSVIILQIKCNCGCNGTYCQPCFYIHYKDEASKISLQRFLENDEYKGELFREPHSGSNFLLPLYIY